MIVERFIEWFSESPNVIVPMVSVIYDLPLKDSEKVKMNALILEALPLVHESDIPILLRSLLKNLRLNSKKIVDMIRSTFSNNSIQEKDTWMVLSDVFQSTFSVNPFAVRAFIKSFKESEHLTKFDILLLFILLERRDKKEIFEIFDRCIIARRISFSEIKSIKKSKEALLYEVEFFKNNNNGGGGGTLPEEKEEEEEFFDLLEYHIPLMFPLKSSILKLIEHFLRFPSSYSIGFDIKMNNISNQGKTRIHPKRISKSISSFISKFFIIVLKNYDTTGITV